ncbi:MAG: hypothetical protein ACLP0J_08810 [Solirubrobacteraceae bacterium]
MGTSGAYGGSSGAGWQRVRRDVDDFVTNPTPDKAEQVATDIANALKWSADSNGDAAPASQAGLPLPGLRVNRPRGGRGGGGGGGGGGAAAGGGVPSRGGSGRSRAVVSRAGGQAVAAGYALRTGDGATLAVLGLDLAELQGLDAFSATERILDELVPATGSIEDGEMRKAAANALLELLDSSATPDGPAAIRLFIVEYIYEIAITEMGAQLRDGSRDGAGTVSEEEMVRDFIRARVDQIELPDNTVTPAQFEAAISTGLEDTRYLLGSSE